MKGFTLIELLATVVIIGILASVALPQYTKAVEKARATEALIVVKAIQDAIQRHLQEFPGEVPTNRSQIADVKLTGGQWLDREGKKACFATKNFLYTIHAPNYIGVHRVDGPLTVCDGWSYTNDIYYVQMRKDMTNQTSRILRGGPNNGFWGGADGKYDYLQSFFE